MPQPAADLAHATGDGHDPVLGTEVENLGQFGRRALCVAGHDVGVASLGAHLGASRLEVELTARGLRVTNPDVGGCCDGAAAAADVITCRPRPDGGGRAWFWTSWNEPIAEADRIVEATTFVLGYLARPRRTNGAGR